MKFYALAVSFFVFFGALCKQEPLSKTLDQPSNIQVAQTKSCYKNIIFDLGGVLVKDKAKAEKKQVATLENKQKTYTYEPIQDVVDLLYLLKKNGFKLFALSNKSKQAHQALVNNFAFMQVFDGVVIASEANASKPDPIMYQYLLKKYLLKAEECLLIDDHDVNVLAGKALGIEGIVFSDCNDLVVRLQNLQILS